MSLANMVFLQGGTPNSRKFEGQTPLAKGLDRSPQTFQKTWQNTVKPIKDLTQSSRSVSITSPLGAPFRIPISGPQGTEPSEIQGPITEPIEISGLQGTIGNQAPLVLEDDTQVLNDFLSKLEGELEALLKALLRSAEANPQTGVGLGSAEGPEGSDSTVVELLNRSPDQGLIQELSQGLVLNLDELNVHGLDRALIEQGLDLEGAIKEVIKYIHIAQVQILIEATPKETQGEKGLSLASMLDSQLEEGLLASLKELVQKLTIREGLLKEGFGKEGAFQERLGKEEFQLLKQLTNLLKTSAKLEGQSVEQPVKPLVSISQLIDRLSSQNLGVTTQLVESQQTPVKLGDTKIEGEVTQKASEVPQKAPEVPTINQVKSEIQQAKEVGSVFKEFTFKGEAEGVPAKEVFRQLISKAHLLTHGKENILRIQLRPEHLGKVAMEISVENGIVKAQFAAESQTVRQLIEGNLTNLRHSLVAQGFKIDEISLATRSEFFWQQNQERSHQSQDFRNNKKDNGQVLSQGVATQDDIALDRVEYGASVLGRELQIDYKV